MCADRLREDARSMSRLFALQDTTVASEQAANCIGS
jgi:hypothetical protein